MPLFKFLCGAVLCWWGVEAVLEAHHDYTEDQKREREELREQCELLELGRAERVRREEEEMEQEERERVAAAGRKVAEVTR